MRAGQKAHLPNGLALDAADIQLEFTAPVFDAIPLQRAPDFDELWSQQVLCFLERKPVRRRVPARNQLLPKPIVEAKIEQCAVHVEQHRIDGRPLDRGWLMHLRMIPTMRDLHALALALIPIVERAGAAIMHIYGDGFTVQRKDDNTPLTAADLESQRIIIEGLRELTPGVPILAEESAQAPWAERRTWRELWVVDPLDGTREFVNRNGEFTVNIALVQGNEPVLGVVSAPAQGVLYWGACGNWRVQPHPGRRSPHSSVRAARPFARGWQPLPRQCRDGKIPGATRAPCPLKHRQFAEILLGGGRRGRPLPAVRSHVGMGYGGWSGAIGGRRRPRHPVGWASIALQLPGKRDKRGFSGLRPLQRAGTRLICAPAQGSNAQGSSVSDGLAQLQRRVQKRWDIEYDLFGRYGQACNTSGRDQRRRNVNLIPFRMGRPGAHPRVAEGAVQGAPAKLRCPCQRRIAAPLPVSECHADL